MKFIADAMLGKLAKRLRLLGFDVLYDRSLDDNGIIRRSLEENRLILTRDTRLAARPMAVHSLLIGSERLKEQLDQIFAVCPRPSAVHSLSRCTECNTLLSALDRQEAIDLVPDQVYRTKRDFLACRTCGRVYWKGSHVDRMALLE